MNKFIVGSLGLGLLLTSTHLMADPAINLNRLKDHGFDKTRNAKGVVGNSRAVSNSNSKFAAPGDIMVLAVEGNGDDSVMVGSAFLPGNSGSEKTDLGNSSDYFAGSTFQFVTNERIKSGNANNFKFQNVSDARGNSGNLSLRGTDYTATADCVSGELNFENTSGGTPNDKMDVYYVVDMDDKDFTLVLNDIAVGNDSDVASMYDVADNEFLITWGCNTAKAKSWWQNLKDALRGTTAVPGTTVSADAEYDDYFDEDCTGKVAYYEHTAECT